MTLLNLGKRKFTGQHRLSTAQRRVKLELIYGIGIALRTDVQLQPGRNI